MPRKSHQSQAHSDQQQSRSDRSDVRRAAASTSIVAHEDMMAQLAEMRRSNPFSLLNVIIALGILFFAWMAAQIWGQLQSGQQVTTEAVAAVQAKQQETHDMILQHGFVLNSVQASVSKLEANCMDKNAVDSRIQILVPPMIRNGGQMLRKPLTVVTNIEEPFN